MTNIGVVGTPHMVFTNLIMTTHVRPPMSLIVAGRYISTNVQNSNKRHRELFINTRGISDHKNGHIVRSSKVALKYRNLKKDVDLNAHGRMFNYIVKANVETSKNYTINAFNYTFKTYGIGLVP
jgi:hypothetical protein